MEQQKSGNIELLEEFKTMLMELRHVPTHTGGRLTCFSLIEKDQSKERLPSTNNDFRDP